MLNPAPALGRGRAAAEALMVDTCTITRATSTTTNPDTGQVSRTTIPVYGGKCRFQDASPAAPPTPKQLGGAGVLVAELQLQLPIAVSDVQPDDLVTCTAAVLDPGLAGRAWRARPTPRKTHATKCVVGLVEVTG